MKRRTSSKQLNSAITNGLLQITKVECHYKSSSHIDEISNEAFKESLDFLCESDIFAGCIGWTFEKNFKTNGYIAECSRTDGNSENIVIAHLCANNGVKCEDIEKMLRVEETEDFAEKV